VQWLGEHHRMPQTLTYSGSAVASSGASVSFSRSMPLEGVNVISVTIANGVTTTVSLGVTAAELKLLLIKPSAPGATIKVTVQPSAKVFTLEEPLILGGAGAASLLGAVTALDIANNGTVPVSIDILVGRDPTTP